MLAFPYLMTMITPPTFDVAFIGSGAACSMTLLEMADALLSSPSASPKLRIAVVERDEQFWCGIPYGQRSSIGSLAIQKLDDFADEPEKAAYRIWLEQNKQRWLAFFQAEGGAAAARWICDNRDALDGNQWGELYLPRFLFGVFLSEQMIAAIAALGERDLAEIVTIRAEAMSAHSADGHYRIPRRGEQRSATARFARPRRVVGEAQRTGRGFQRHLAGSALPNASRRAHPRTRPVHHRHLALRRAALHDLQSAAGV